MFAMSNKNTATMILSASTELLFGLALMAIGIIFIVLFKDKRNSHYKKSRRLAIEFRDRVLDSTHGYSYRQKDVRNTLRTQGA